MTDSTQVTLLRRMTRPQGQEVADNPLTSSRAVRLALTKAANDTVGLVLTVQSVAEEVTSLDDMLGTLADELMLVALERDGGLAGLIALDMEMRAAVLEMETMGAVLAHPAEARAPTLTDKTLCDPLLQAFLSAFPLAVLDTPLEGWMDSVVLGHKIESTRAAGLVLADRDYRIVRLSVDLGVAERQAELVIVLPVVQHAPEPETTPETFFDWDSDFQDRVSDAPARLDALLHRFPISLATAQGLQVGSVLPLPGCTVNSVRLLSPDGHEVAQAKLGQIGGYRAVRLEAAPAPQLIELPGTTADVGQSLPDAMDVDLGGGDVLGDVPHMDDGLASGEVAEAAMDIDLMSGDMPEIDDLPFDPDAL
ncbi:FliM/FliN family flagellar motor switch protein [Roseobacter sp. CCS2]|uniref:FliM/FliN family flagellar motor switch protein n=1 Tax=Roseobacter sp. CCS2 TaxID=391593 RepID=UPI0000F3F750|nr:flagellar motor switch protein FliM [Roseobacter sp. CCS2]EBA10623.1 possible flagellar switch protein FliM [Roseobacter sp. CCS2]